MDGCFGIGGYCLCRRATFWGIVWVGELALDSFGIVRVVRYSRDRPVDVAGYNIVGRGHCRVSGYCPGRKVLFGSVDTG